MQNTFLVIIIMLFTIQPVKREPFDPVIVLELFTSQGCSSCPRADALLTKVKDKVDTKVVALSYHVDYWNYIGWIDPFSNKYNTNKQRAYGQKFLSRQMYTPQLVINGKEHIVGSNEKLLSKKLETYGKKTVTNKITLSKVEKNEGTVSFNYTIEGATENKDIRFALVIDARTTEIKRGENRNLKINNENIVINETLKNIETLSGTMRLKIPDLVSINDDLRVIAIIQTKNLSITGATQQPL